MTKQLYTVILAAHARRELINITVLRGDFFHNFVISLESVFFSDENDLIGFKIFGSYQELQWRQF